MDADSTKLLDDSAKIDTGAWSDALDACGIEGVVRGLVQRSGVGRFAAFAVTAKQSVGLLGAYPRKDFGVGQMVAATGAGRVLMIDTGGAEVSTFGANAALASKLREVAAVVIDGACRDLDEIRETGLWLASRHVSPMAGKTRIRLDLIGGPITVGGVAVCDGDLVVGDDTGLVVVPRTDAARVLAAAVKIVTADREVERLVRAGTPFGEAASAANYI